MSTSTTDSGFLLFTGTLKSEFAACKFIEGFEDDYKLRKGIPVAKEWPADVVMPMDPNFKTRIKLSDHLYNRASVILASERLCDFFRTEQIPDVEYLPVTIINHKKRPERAKYSIVHLINSPDCIDKKKSELDWNAINPDDITSVRRLTLDESKIAKTAVLFRAKHLKGGIFVRRDLAKKLQTQGFTGIVFKEIATFTC
jgi:hypothetical protein